MTNVSPDGQQVPTAAAAPGATLAQGGQGVATVGQPTQPGQAPTGGPEVDAAAASRNTPRLLARLRAAVVVTSLLFAVVCLFGTAMPYGALTGARQDIEQGQRLRNAQASLARAEALAAEAADPKVNGDPSAFRAEADALSATLVTAAAAFPADSPGLAAAVGQVASYRAAVEVGLAQRTGGDPGRAQSAIAAANSGAATTAAATLRDLTGAADSRLPARFTSTAAPLVVAAAAVALLTALVAATYLGLRTRRLLNVGVTLAVIALLAALGLAVAASSAVTGGADVAQGHVLSTARAATETQGLVELARTAQLTGTGNGQSWAQVATQVRERLTIVSSPAASTAWSQAEAAQAKGDLPATRIAIDAVTSALAPVAAEAETVATGAVAFEKLLAYGIGAAALAVAAALLSAWGISTRLNEYR